MEIETRRRHGGPSHICTTQFIYLSEIEVRSDKLLVLKPALAVFLITHVHGNPQCNAQ